MTVYEIAKTRQKVVVAFRKNPCRSSALCQKILMNAGIVGEFGHEAVVQILMSLDEWIRGLIMVSRWKSRAWERKRIIKPKQAYAV